jgi:AraC family transcriptional regulator
MQRRRLFMQTDVGRVSARRNPVSLQSVLADERAWREIPHRVNRGPLDDVVIGYWADGREARRELTAPMSAGHYTISILLGKASVDCYKNGRLLDRGTGGPGGVQLTAPGERVTCSFRGANEAVHIFVPRDVIESEYVGLRGESSALRLEDPAFRVDPVLVSTAKLLAATRGKQDQADVWAARGLFDEILGHVLSRYAHEGSATASMQGLAPQRVRRAIDYIEANLGEPITLHDVARHVGLSRMHFAAQFKLATGCSPHAFLRSRRIERAKTLLMDDMPIVDVALAVGFQGQAHFTTVFRELDGLTPKQWAEKNRKDTTLSR